MTGRRIGIALLALLVLLGGCTRTQTGDQSTETAVSASTEPETQTDAEPQPLPQTDAKALDVILKRYGAVGAQAAVIRDGRVVSLFHYGFADEERQMPVTDASKYCCASLSKTVCAMVAAELERQGRFDPDADVGTLLGFTVRDPRYPDTVITPRMLMTHTSSITDSTEYLRSRNAVSAEPLQTLLSRRSSYTSAEPGKEYSYSNFGAAVLAAAVECVADASFESLAQKYLFRPLGIDASFSASTLRHPELTAVLFNASGDVQWSYERQLQECPVPQIGQTHHIYQTNLTVSACDYARVLCLLMHTESAGKIYPAAAAKAVCSPQFTDDTVTHGLFTRRVDHLVEGRSLWIHAGYNFGMFAAYAIDLADSSGVVVMTSGANASLDEFDLPDVCTEMIRALYTA